MMAMTVMMMIFSDDDDDDEGDVDDDDDDKNCAGGGNLSRHDHCQLLISLQIWAQDRHLTENAQHLSWQNTKIHNVQQIQSTKYYKYKDTKIWTEERPALVLTKQPSQQYQTRGHSSSMSQSTIARQTLFLTKGKIARFPASDQEYRLSSKCQRGSDWLTPDDVTLRDIVTLRLAIVTSGRVEV